MSNNPLRWSSTSAIPLIELLFGAYGYEVDVVAYPGYSNCELIDDISKYFTCAQSMPDAVVFLQTDPLRDICCMAVDNSMLEGWEETALKNLQIDSWTAAHFEQQVENTLLKTYSSLIELMVSECPDADLLILGGHGTVRPDLVEQAARSLDYRRAHVPLVHVVVDCLKHTTPDHNLDDGYPHPCHNMRIAHLVDSSWQPCLVKLLHEIHLHTIMQKMPELRNAYWPDYSHAGASIIVILVELLVQCLEKLQTQQTNI